MLNKHYEELEKVKDQACFLLGYMKSSLEFLDNLENDNPLNLSKEEAQERVISELREQLKELEGVIYSK